ncbi:MAG: HdeD family acid-resistance protein [Eubacterium sp.]
MKKLLTEIKKYSLIGAIVLAVLGVLLIAAPGKMLRYTAFIIGGVCIACGVYAIISYIVNKASSFVLTLGIISTITGIVICAAYRQIVSIIIFILGIILLAGGVVDLVNSVYVAVSRRRSWILTVILSVASIVLGIISITNPFDTQEKIVQFVGAGLVVFAVVDIIAYIQVMAISKEVQSKISRSGSENSAVEVDYEEVDDN